MGSHFAADYRQIFNLRRLTGTNSRGDSTYGGPIPAACRFQPSTRLVRGVDGQMHVEEGVLHTELLVTVKDLVWKPGDDPADYTLSKRPLRVDVAVDLESGATDHYEVHL